MTENEPVSTLIDTTGKQTCEEPNVTQMFDIASIQPRASACVEEQKHGHSANQSDLDDNSLMNATIAAAGPKKRTICQIDAETCISFTTSLDTETDAEHSVKPLDPLLTLESFKSMIKRAHSLDEKFDFTLCCRQTHMPVEFDKDPSLPQTVLNLESGLYLLAVINERYNSEHEQQYLEEQKHAASRNPQKEQPTNLEKSIKLDPLLQGKAQKEQAIKDILTDKFPDIVKDRICGQKYKCFFAKCRKTFKHLKQLFEHQKIHLKNFRPFECDKPGCKKSFMSRGHLRNHADTHKQLKNFVCPIQGCNESYSRQQRLKVHLKKHAGNRDFVCPFENCSKAFYEKGNLKTHLRLHTGEKPYHCTAVECDKSFATQGHLNDHFSKTHFGSSKRIPEKQPRQGLTATAKDSLPRTAEAPLQNMVSQTNVIKASESGALVSASGGDPSLGVMSNYANNSSGFVDTSMFTGIQMQVYNQTQLNGINRADQNKMLAPTQQLSQSTAQLSGQAQPDFKQTQRQQSMGVYASAQVGAQPERQSSVMRANEESSQNKNNNSASIKRKKLLKINVKAANNVEVDLAAYNANANSVPKPIDMQSAKMRQDLETQSMMHNQLTPGSAGKKEMCTDYMPFFFSFKDYEHKAGQTRGAQTCIKIENRTLNPPTPLKANAEVHLDDSHSQSNQSQFLQQRDSVNLTKSNENECKIPAIIGETTSLAQAFGLKPQKNKSEFVPPPAKTPLNQRQLAKRRFFYADPQVSEDSHIINGSEAESMAASRRKRELKAYQKNEETLSRVAKNKMLPPQSENYKSVNEMSQQTIGGQGVVRPSDSGQSGTFAPRMAILSQNSNLIELNKDIGPSASELSDINKRAEAFQRGVEIINSVPGPADGKASETSNVLTMNDLKVCSASQKNSSSQKPSSGNAFNQAINNNIADIDSERPTLLSQLPYAQATATCVKKPQTTMNFFDHQQNGVPANDPPAKPYSCQKLPERNEHAFFNVPINSESKKTPFLIEDEESSLKQLNNKSMNSQNNQLQALYDRSKQKRAQYSLPGLSELQSDIDMQMTPIQSQNQSQTQKLFNFQQPNVAFTKHYNGMQQVIASPLISNQSNLMGAISPAMMSLHFMQNGAGTGNGAYQASGPGVGNVKYNNNMVMHNLNNQSSSGSKGGTNLANPLPKLSSSLTDRSPSSLRWDRSQHAISPISHNFSNPSMFFAPNNQHQQPQQQFNKMQQQHAAKQQQFNAHQGSSRDSNTMNQPQQQVSKSASTVAIQTNLVCGNPNAHLVLMQVDPQQFLQILKQDNQAAEHKFPLSQDQAACVQSHDPRTGVVGASRAEQTVSNISGRGATGSSKVAQQISSSKPNQCPSAMNTLLQQVFEGTPQKNDVGSENQMVDQPNQNNALPQSGSSVQNPPHANEDVLTQQQCVTLQGQVAHSFAVNDSQACMQNKQSIATQCMRSVGSKSDGQMSAPQMKDKDVPLMNEKVSQESKSSSFNRHYKMHTDLMKKKAQYMLKIHKIEGAMQVQNNMMMQKAIQQSDSQPSSTKLQANPLQPLQPQQQLFLTPAVDQQHLQAQPLMISAEDLHRQQLLAMHKQREVMGTAAQLVQAANAQVYGQPWVQSQWQPQRQQMAYATTQAPTQYTAIPAEIQASQCGSAISMQEPAHGIAGQPTAWINTSQGVRPVGIMNQSGQFQPIIAEQDRQNQVLMQMQHALQMRGGMMEATMAGGLGGGIHKYLNSMYEPQPSMLLSSLSLSDSNKSVSVQGTLPVNVFNQNLSGGNSTAGFQQMKQSQPIAQNQRHQTPSSKNGSLGQQADVKMMSGSKNQQHGPTPNNSNQQ